MRGEEKSAKLFEEAKSLMPGGVNSPVRACSRVGRIPRFIERAIGSHIFDVDGNEYIDYVLSWGPAILGHAHPKVVEAVKLALANGLTFGAPTENEVKMARLIHELIPSMEISRMVSSGTEAVMSAIRLARGFTKRDDILKFASCYHGHSDGMLVKAGSGALTAGESDSAGVIDDYAKHTLVASYNDLNTVENIFRSRGDKIAAVIVEPVAANCGVILPQNGFLDGLRKITERYGALLIFDEVITGFRLALGGAQEYFGVRPDLTTLGKIVGGGMPAAVYGGRADIMALISPVGSVYQAGTLSGNPLATAAGIATIEELKRDPTIYSRLEAKTELLANAIDENMAEVHSIGSLMSIDFKNDADVTFARWYSYLLDNGIYVAPSRFEAMFISIAHDESDIERTISVMKGFRG